MRAHTRRRGGDETPFIAEVLEERLTLEWPTGSAVVPLRLARPTTQAKILLELTRQRLLEAVSAPSPFGRGLG
jgi:protein ImuB